MEAKSQLRPVMAMPSRILMSLVVIFPRLLKNTAKERLHNMAAKKSSSLFSLSCIAIKNGISRVTDMATIRRLSI